MIHMVKLCVGVSSVEELESYRDQRAHWWGADYGEDVHVHRTRMMPGEPISSTSAASSPAPARAPPPRRCWG